MKIFDKNFQHEENCIFFFSCLMKLPNALLPVHTVQTRARIMSTVSRIRKKLLITICLAFLPKLYDRNICKKNKSDCCQSTSLQIGNKHWHYDFPWLHIHESPKLRMANWISSVRHLYNLSERLLNQKRNGNVESFEIV